MSEERRPLEKVIEETKKGLIELTLPGQMLQDEEIDTSYITQELIDAYWRDARDKDDESVQMEMTTGNNIACYWGNHWALISGRKWAYSNGHSGTGCDPATTAVLCGSSNRWTVHVSKLDPRWCNGRPIGKMAWR